MAVDGVEGPNAPLCPGPPGVAEPANALPTNPYPRKLDPWSSHSLVLATLAACPAGTRVLEVGTATGLLGQAVYGRGFDLLGIEPNATWAEQARPYYSRIETALLEDVPDYLLRDHDVAICADVLEHMPDPEEALRRLVRLEPQGCRFVVSVPNVANVWVRLNLLLGRFEYRNAGILDRTHLRFYTKSSLLAMVESCGLAVQRVDCTPIPLPRLHPAFESTPMGRAILACLAFATRRWMSLLSYQFVIQAVKP